MIAFPLLRLFRSVQLAVFTGLLLLGPAAQPNLALGEESGNKGFTVAPLKVDVSVAPGETATGALRVFTNVPGERYKVEVGDVTQNDDGSYNYDAAAGKEDSVSSWISIDPTTFSSGVGTVEPITWTVSVPKDADPGDRLAAIYVTQVAKPKAGEVVLQSRIAVRMELNIQGDVKFAPEIEPVQGPKYASGGPIKFSTAIANNGNVRIDLRKAKVAEWQVRDGDKIIARQSLVPKDKTIPVTLFPGAVRPFEFTWKDTPSYGRFDVRLQLTFADEGSFQRGATVNVVPYRQAGGVGVIGLGVLILLGATLVSSRRRRRSEPGAN